MKQKKLLLLTTGGTIASADTEAGLAPTITGAGLTAFVGSMLSAFDVEVQDILRLDSSNMQPEEWEFIARTIHGCWEAYDGVVLTHGTDTMAYTASVLSYMLHDKKARGGSITLVKVPGLGCWRLDKVPVSELETIVMGK